ncbi:leucyl/phenylalanyl-tRNA--protein transferase, partial [Pseudomonas aeruginosa]
MLTWLSRTDFDFPPLDKALQEPNGLLAAGGDLNPQRLVAAYRHGCFPWYQDGQPILWWSPDPRTVLFPDELHVSRSLAKCLRQQRFE